MNGQDWPQRNINPELFNKAEVLPSVRVCSPLPWVKTNVCKKLAWGWLRVLVVIWAQKISEYLSAWSTVIYALAAAPQFGCPHLSAKCCPDPQCSTCISGLFWLFARSHCPGWSLWSLHMFLLSLLGRAVCEKIKTGLFIWTMDFCVWYWDC